MAYQEPVEEEPTIGKLVVDAFDDVGTLLRHMIELAKSEMKVSVRAGGMAIGLFGAAVFLLLMSLVLVSFSAAYFIVMAGLDPAWAFLIVFGAYVVLALVCAFVGYLKIRKVKAPQRTMAQASELPKALSH
ncbi:phage holin family protein [Nocardioides marmorisolisilvae]|uniref:Phage holin family protein n=1 Tax=Nocardioides marmorisolisilvae TaxID=1542737 RepID=A0A3N0E0D3_9ACTN|nr:phage holin family protein [Nocardioides marmorisolisilvae]RNL81301.1 phage holin family protein [Nocardioides marmorisolisilvae]